MRNTWAIAKREFIEYFSTPIGYIIVGAFAAVAGLAFTTLFITHAEISQAPGSYGETGVPDFEENMLSPFLVFCAQLIMFIGPLITMRLLAEERNRGTMELLLTHPIQDREIIFGKYLAGLGMLALMLVVTGVHLSVIAYYTDVEAVVLWLGLASVLLTGASFIALGLFVSALCATQAAAATITFAIWFVAYIIGTLGEKLPEEYPAPETMPDSARRAFDLFYSIFRQIVNELPIDAHAREMAQGVFQPKDLAYYLLLTTFFLFLTFRALESRKWRA